MKENLGPRHVVNFIEKASREQTYPQLQNALDRHNGKNFCLRGVQEHLSLRFNQLHRVTDPDRYIYTEFGLIIHF